MIVGLILGAVLALLFARRAAIGEAGPPQEASIELKERATQLAKDTYEGAVALGERAQATLERIVPGEKTTES